jgi:hypothetical protein
VNKRAIELSINFIVMFILGMSMFAAGVIVLRKVFGQAEDLKQQLDQQTKDQIEHMLISSSEKTVVPVTQKQVDLGGHTIFGLGIRNDLSAKKDFYIYWECDAAYTTKKDLICDPDQGVSCSEYGTWMGGGQSPSTAYPLEKNAHIVADLFVMVPKKDSADQEIPAGTYIFNLKVCSYDAGLYSAGNVPPECTPENQYDTTKKIKVVVN